jgi:hypothetical protein
MRKAENEWCGADLTESGFEVHPRARLARVSCELQAASPQAGSRVSWERILLLLAMVTMYILPETGLKALSCQRCSRT